jgi:hypothetical protein
MSNADKGGRSRFRKGQSANPGGRPKGYGNVRDLAREYTEEAIEALVALMRDGSNKMASAKAASELLSRGWGQPTAYIEQTSSLAEEIDKIKARANRPTLDSIVVPFPAAATNDEEDEEGDAG